jgi:hypothetical protein
MPEHPSSWLFAKTEMYDKVMARGDKNIVNHEAPDPKLPIPAERPVSSEFWIGGPRS